MEGNTKRAHSERPQADSILSSGQALEGTCLEQLNEGQLEHVSGGSWTREVVQDVEAY